MFERDFNSDDFNCAVRLDNSLLYELDLNNAASSLLLCAFNLMIFLLDLSRSNLSNVSFLASVNVLGDGLSAENTFLFSLKPNFK